MYYSRLCAVRSTLYPTPYSEERLLSPFVLRLLLLLYGVRTSPTGPVQGRVDMTSISTTAMTTTGATGPLFGRCTYSRALSPDSRHIRLGPGIDPVKKSIPTDPLSLELVGSRSVVLDLSVTNPGPVDSFHLSHPLPWSLGAQVRWYVWSSKGPSKGYGQTRYDCENLLGSRPLWQGRGLQAKGVVSEV